jgi:hypothetical protein
MKVQPRSSSSKGDASLQALIAATTPKLLTGAANHKQPHDIVSSLEIIEFPAVGLVVAIKLSSQQ